MTSQQSFGRIEQGEAFLYTLRNRNGCEARVTNYGATLTHLFVPDRFGRFEDVVLGYDDVQGYAQGRAFIGATCGRVANRIAGSVFELGGARYAMQANDPPHNLHSRPIAWDARLWRRVSCQLPNSVSLALSSPAGESNFPGNVEARATFQLTEDNKLCISMTATADALTLVNMAHHGYWNLAGHGSASILDHVLTLECDAYTPGNPLAEKGVVPYGVVQPVKHTPFDFTRAKSIGADIAQVSPMPEGYDHNFVVRGNPSELRRVATLVDPSSGRGMLLSANQPGVQFYAGNSLDAAMRGKRGVSYARRSALCLETQAFPNAVNVPAWRKQVLLAPGGEYRHEMVHAFFTA